jgi:hypothetical protein
MTDRDGLLPSNALTAAGAETFGERLRIPPTLANWTLCWVVLPNLPFAAMWLVGGPPRAFEIFAVGMIGLIIRRAPFWVQFPAFLALLATSVMFFVAALFSLSVRATFFSMRFVLELKPSASFEYVVIALSLVAVVALAFKYLRRPQDFDRPMHIIAAGCLLFGIGAADLWASAGTRSSYRGLPSAGEPFSSAATQTRFDALAKDGNHLVIVMVEAMGVPRDPALQAKLSQRWREADIGHVYDVRFGSAPFWGSTTYGEMRELCGRWGDYHGLIETRDRKCLPARLAAQGYRTTAIHGFDDSFFSRSKWYPNIGFQQAMFREDLLKRGAEKCGGVFPGACDRSVPATVAERLKTAKSKQFIYWLTLNSHIPVPASDQLRTKECARFDPVLARDHAMICRLFSLWNDTNQGLAAMLSDPALPPTDVLIVGDHAPPFFDRSQRTQFQPGRVSWVLLKHRGSRQPKVTG